MYSKVLIKMMIIPIVVSIGFLSSSCTASDIKKDGLLYGEVVGELYHTQYWNSNDHWDLKNMYLILHYEDESIERVDATDYDAHYTFSPATPDGLPLGETSFELVSGYYVDYKGEQHEILPRTFNGAYIVNNPNKTGIDSSAETIIKFIVLGLVGILTIICLVGLFVKLFRKKKEEK